MASPSISDILRPESLALINTSNNCWMMKRLCSISTSFTNRENPLMSGIKSKPLFSISFFLKLATNQVYTEGLPALQSAINYSIFLNLSPPPFPAALPEAGPPGHPCGATLTHPATPVQAQPQSRGGALRLATGGAGGLGRRARVRGAARR